MESDRHQYTLRPAGSAEVRKNRGTCTLILAGDLRHLPEKAWLALADPAHRHEGARFRANASLGTVAAATHAGVRCLYG